MNNCISEINKYNPDVLFIDCFDTLLHRKSHADDIIMMWSSNIVKHFNLPILNHEMFECRKFFLFKLESVGYSPTIIDVYRKIYIQFINYLLPKTKIADFVDYCLETELRLEKESTYVDDSIYEVLKFAHENKKRCFIISDFYLDEKNMKSLIISKGVMDYFEDIFVSCDIGKRKSGRGEIYLDVCNRIHVSPNNCMMIGDNYFSDYKNAINMGLMAFYKEWTDYGIFHGEKWTKLQLWNLHKRAKKRNPFSEYAFSLYLFSERLYKDIEKQGINNIVFFAREGQFLKLLFDKYLFSLGKTDITTHYAYVSRYATYSASLNSISEEDFHILRRQYPNMSISDFIKNIGMDNCVTAESLGIDGEEYSQMITSFWFSKQFRDLKKNKIFVEAYESNRVEKGKLLKQYFSRFIDKEKSSVAVVDIGWKGTIQDNIFNCFDKKLSCTGYYLGLSDWGDSSANNRKKGLLFEPIRKTNDNAWRMLESYFFESLIQADHNQVLGFADNGKKILLNGNGRNSLYEKCKGILQLVESTYIDILNLFEESLVDAEDLADLFSIIQYDFVYKYDIKKTHIIRNIQKNNEKDSFGNFTEMKRDVLISILRAIKHYGLFSNQTFERIIATGTIWIPLYSKLFCRYNARSEGINYE